MFRLKIKFGSKWKLGKVEYSTYEEAENRANELKSLRKGVQIKITDKY